MNPDWHMYANLYNTLVIPIIDQMRGLIGNVVAGARPFALALIVVWVGIVGIEVGAGRKNLNAAIWEFLVAAVAVGFLISADVYLQWIGNPFLTILPDSLAGLFGAHGTPADGMDNVLNQAIGAAIRSYKAMPWSLEAVPLGIGIIMFVIIAFLSTGFAFFLYVAAVVTNVIAVFVGPICVGLAGTPKTRRFAAGWLGVLVGGVTTQVLALAVLLLMTATEAASLHQIVTQIATGADAMTMILDLGKCGLLLFLCTHLVKRIPDIAHSIGGGVYHHAQTFSAVTFGLTAGVAAGAASIATKGATKIASSAVNRARQTEPTGKSLSSAR